MLKAIKSDLPIIWVLTSAYVLVLFGIVKLPIPIFFFYHFNFWEALGLGTLGRILIPNIPLEIFSLFLLFLFNLLFNYFVVIVKLLYGIELCFKNTN